MPETKTVDELIVELRLRADAMEQGLVEVGRDLEKFAKKQSGTAQQAGKETGDAAKQAADKVRAEADRAALAVSGAAGIALAGIVSAVKDAIAAASEYKNAMTGLSSIAEGTGQDMTALQAAVNDLTADGLMPASDAATALKNLLARGFAADEAVALLKRLKDAAAFGRQGTLSLGEAVRSAAEGIKNENSVNYCPAWGRPLAA